MKYSFILSLFIVLAATVAPVSAQTVSVENLEASGTSMGVSTGPFTLYSLRDGELLLSRDDVSRADSVSTNWDIGFRGVTIIANGGTSGPGNGAVAILDVPYADVDAVPEDATFVTDGDNLCPTDDANAICSGSENGWYVYKGSGVLDPMPDRTFVIRLAEEGYAKLRIVGYEIVGENARHYTFEYEKLSADSN